MSSDLNPFLQEVLDTSIGSGIRLEELKSLAGGCINQTAKLDTSEGSFFVKWNADEFGDMFEKEAKGLNLLRNHFKLNVPEVLNTGVLHSRSYLLLEYLAPAPRQKDYWKQLGVALANLHRATHSKFGLDHDNYIGRLPQANQWQENGMEFLVSRRLEPQVQLAIRNGFADTNLADRFKRFYRKLPDLIPDESPALIHGDLWSGNLVVGPDGQGGLIDPAVYFGHREAELAFTQLFGGFDSEFYSSYHSEFPLQPGFDERVDIYNLYPLLVHLNLFGMAYYSGIDRILRRFI